MATFHLTHAAEIWTPTGATGEHAEVTRGEVRDYGGNVLFAGTADECVKQAWRIPTRLVPTEWTKVDGEVSGADHTWQIVISPSSPIREAK